MATKMMTAGTTLADRIVAGALATGLVLALMQYAQTLALPAHFV